MKKLAIGAFALFMVSTQGVFAQDRLQKGEAAAAETEVASEATDKAMTAGEDLTKVRSAEAAKEMARKKTEELDRRVDLTEDQKKQIFDINQATFMKAKDLKASNPEMSSAELRAEGDRLLAERDDQVMSLLTPEQQSNMRGKSGMSGEELRQRAEQAAAKQTRELHEVVDLSAAQKTEIRDLNQQLYMKGAEYKMANPGISAEELKAYKKELMVKRFESYKEILTAEQIEKFMAHKKATK